MSGSEHILVPKTAIQIIDSLSEANCFVYMQGNDADIEKYYDLVRASKDDKIILYPEHGRSFIDMVCYRQYVKSVVTENPWVISSYDKRKVWIIRNGEWINPSEQTYGCSTNIITSNILGYDHTIPLAVIGGIEEIEKYREKIKNNNLRDDYY